MWSIVHFAQNNSVEVEPTYWVNGDNCAWPKNNYEASKLNNSRVKPNDFEFDYYRVRVFFTNISMLFILMCQPLINDYYII